MDKMRLLTAGSWIATLTAALALPVVAPAVPAALAMLTPFATEFLKNLVGNWASEDLRREKITPGDYDRNHHLEEFTALALQAAVHCLPDHLPQHAAHRALCEKLGQALHDTWLHLSPLTYAAAPSRGSRQAALKDPVLAGLAPSRLPGLIQDHITTPEKATALTAGLWRNILLTAWGENSPPLPEDLLRAASKHLRRRTPRYLYEAAKLSAEHHPAAYAAIQLRLQSEQTAYLKSLLRQATELSALLGDYFQELVDFLMRLFDHYLGTLPETLRLIKSDTARIIALLEQHLPGLRVKTAGKLKFKRPRKLPQAASRLIGRDDEVARILPLLGEHRRLALWGPGGVGKTALAAELLLRYTATPAGKRATKGGIYYHDCYRDATLPGFVSGILRQAGLHIEDYTQQPAYAALALQQPGVLLYLEGAEKLPSLQPILDFLDDSTRLFFTTRHQDQTRGCHPCHVDRLTGANAARVLHYYAAEDDLTAPYRPYPYSAGDPGWYDLARDLGGHALGCRLAGTHCGILGLAPGAFHHHLTQDGLTSLRQDGHRAHDGLATLSQGEDKGSNLDLLYRSIARSLAQRNPGSPSPALHTWHTLTLFGVNPVPLSVLTALGAADQTGLSHLITHGLLTRDLVSAEPSADPAAPPPPAEPAYALTHALLVTWGKQELPTHYPSLPDPLPPAMAWGEALCQKVVAHSGVPGGPDRYNLHHPLASALLTAVQTGPPLPPLRLYTFYYLPAWMHSMHGQFPAAEPLYRYGLAAMQDHPAPAPPITAAALSNLATLLQETTRLAEAEPCMREALRIYKASCGKDDPQVAFALNNLATLLQDTNRSAEAEPHMREALRIYKASFGKDHPDVAVALDNLAQLLKATNRLAEAEPLMREALGIRLASYGNNHPDVALSLHNLSYLLQATNRLAEAELLMREALRIREARYGKVHPAVAQSQNSLALVLKATNRLDKAEELIREALSIDEACYGKDHHQVASSLNNLAHLLHTTNRIAEAEPMLREALRIHKASYGKEHPHVALALNNLAGLLKDTDRLAEAESLMREALRIRQASFGKDHPDVANSMHTLAALLKANNRLAEAEPHMRRALEILLRFTAVTGYEHPNVRVFLFNYGGLCEEMEVPLEEFVARLWKMAERVGLEWARMMEIYAAMVAE